MADGIEGLLEIAGAAAVEGLAMVGSEREYCANCGAKFEGPFCAACGAERDTHRRSVFGLLHDLFEDILSFDSRILRTTRALVAMPGELPRAFREGRVRRYVPPVRLYFFVTLMFFLAVSISGIAIMKLQIVEQHLTAAQQTKLRLGLQKAREETKAALAKAQAGLTKAKADLAVAKAARAHSGPDGDERISEINDQIAELTDQITELNGDTKDALDTADNMNLGSGKDVTSLSARFFEPGGGPPPKLSPAVQKEIDAVQARLVKKQNELTVAGTKKTWELWFVNHIQKAMITLTRDPAAVNGPLMDWIPRSLFFLLPIFALLLAMFYVRQRKAFYFVDHLVFSLNVHTFVFVVLTALVVAAQFVTSDKLGWFALAAVAIYLFLAMKRFYGQGWALTTVKFLGISFVYSTFFLAPAIIMVILASLLEA